MERHCGVLHGLMNQKVVKEVSRYAWGEDSGIIQSVQFIYYTNKLNPALTDPSVSNFISPKSNVSKCGRAIAILIKQSGRRFLQSNYFLNNLSFIQLHLCFTWTGISYTTCIAERLSSRLNINYLFFLFAVVSHSSTQGQRRVRIRRESISYSCLFILLSLVA